jgi:hypothetical protein
VIASGTPGAADLAADIEAGPGEDRRQGRLGRLLRFSEKARASFNVSRTRMYSRTWFRLSGIELDTLRLLGLFFFLYLPYADNTSGILPQSRFSAIIIAF